MMSVVNRKAINPKEILQLRNARKETVRLEMADVSISKIQQ